MSPIYLKIQHTRIHTTLYHKYKGDSDACCWQILSMKFHKCMENKETIPVISLGITYEATWVAETRLSSVAGQEPLLFVLVACGQSEAFPSEQDCSTRRKASRNSLMSMWPSLLKSMLRARSQIQSSVMSIFI